MDKEGDKLLTFRASLQAKKNSHSNTVSLPFQVSTVFASRQMHPDNFEIRCRVWQADGENTVEGTGC